MQNQPDYTDFHRDMSAAKMRLLSIKSLGFMACLLFNLKVFPDTKTETIATNGIDIFVNPEWFIKLDHSSKTYALMHTTMHIALKHPSRMQGRDPKLWQSASDYVVNQGLSDYGLQLPQGSLLDKQYKDKTTESIYELLLEKQKDGDKDPEPDHNDLMPPPVAPPGQQPNQGDSPNNSDQNNSEGEGNSDNTSFETQEDFDNKISDLLNDSKTQSKLSDNFNPAGLPKELQKLLNDLEKPLLPWHSILRRYLQALAKNNYSFSKPNRRYLPHDVYLPSRISEGLERIDFIIDTSGSISTKEFTQFITEVDKVLKQFKPESIGVSQFDHKYRGTDIVNSTTDIRKLKFKGGGGTSIATTLKAVGEQPTKCMVIFTDGYMNLNLTKPKVPVIWAIYGNDNFQAPFGQTIHFKLKDIG